MKFFRKKRRGGMVRRSAEHGFTSLRRSAEHGFTSLRRSAEHGFTLVELMVVIVIIGLLATIVAINVIPATDTARVEKAKADIAVIEQALEQYRLDNLGYPTQTQGLAALLSAPAGLAQPERYRRGGYIRKLPDDPWGRAYQYRVPGEKGAFDIISLGADGQPGGTEDNADIRSSAL
ncbi:type II secretion system protein GspG [Sphingobium jiangsuense]|uniref:Type II secretion system core protein G n=2 Tax=Sphingobium jiangsuense TaxID=870476 RepID=A0A7W6BPL0_9SPHN|nr:general secretion pathway protein G [Sphingobium jiangsuense]GLT01239.1 type II secretion system protein GspG [Sphingobium jiangsuense]